MLLAAAAARRAARVAHRLEARVVVVDTQLIVQILFLTLVLVELELLDRAAAAVAAAQVKMVRLQAVLLVVI
jgi:hypothetical protein